MPASASFMLLASLLGMLIGVLFARIVAEFVLIVFRINEHLGGDPQPGDDAYRAQLRSTASAATNGSRAQSVR